MTPDKRSHRGAHPEDRRLFADEQLPVLRQAVDHLSWLLTREYPIAASLKLVGDRFKLRKRQRTAVGRSACSDQALAARRSNRIPIGSLSSHDLAIDGFNLLITLEAALGGGVILRGRDGCLRDLASIHGSYRRVSETEEAIRQVGRLLSDRGAGAVTWLLDRPVSNSGRLRARILEIAAEEGWPWEVELPFNPDRALADGDDAVVTSDSAILDAGVAWVDLAGEILSNRRSETWLLDFGGTPPGADARAR